MKIGKKIASITLILVSFVFMVFLSCQYVKADFYDASKNKIIENSIYVSREKNLLEVAFEYQNGIRGVEIYICEGSDVDECVDDAFITKFIDTNARFNRGDGVAKYEASFRHPSSGKQLQAYTDKFDTSGKPDNNYYLVARATFCVVRESDKQGCAVWDVDNEDKGKYETSALPFSMEQGYTGSADVNKTIDKVLYIVNSIVIPVLWVALGILLVVRGIILGIDIVKSSDEPDVRKSKINGLIWLFIGVGVGFAVSIAASVVMTSFGYGGIFS